MDYRFMLGISRLLIELKMLQRSEDFARSARKRR